VNQCLTFATHHQRVDASIRQRAQELEDKALHAVDALCAEAAGSDYLLTCDDQVVRRYRGKIKALNPTDFVLLMGGRGR